MKPEHGQDFLSPAKLHRNTLRRIAFSSHFTAKSMSHGAATSQRGSAAKTYPTLVIPVKPCNDGNNKAGIDEWLGAAPRLQKGEEDREKGETGRKRPLGIQSVRHH